MWRNHFNAFRYFQSRRSGIDNEGAETSRPGFFAGADEQGIEVGNTAVRYPGLLAVDDVIGAIFYCSRGQ